MDGVRRGTFDGQLVDGILPLAGDLPERLGAGIRVADIGCGTGHAIEPARPGVPASSSSATTSRRTRSPAAADRGRRWGLTNVSFEVLRRRPSCPPTRRSRGRSPSTPSTTRPTRPACCAGARRARARRRVRDVRHQGVQPSGGQRRQPVRAVPVRGQHAALHDGLARRTAAPGWARRGARSSPGGCWPRPGSSTSRCTTCPTTRWTPCTWPTGRSHRVTDRPGPGVRGSGPVRVLGRGELPREVGVLAVIAFVVALGFGIVAPAIPLFARAFGVGTTAVGLAVSAFAFFRFVSAFSGGTLVERFGERVVLTAGLLIVAVTTGLAGLAGNFPVFLALRAAGGVGSAMFTVAALSLLLRVAPPSHRGRAAATWQGGFILGGIAGPGRGRPAGRAVAAAAVLPVRRLPDGGRRRRRRPAARRPHGRRPGEAPVHAGPDLERRAASRVRDGAAVPRLHRGARRQSRRRVGALRRPQLAGPAVRHRGTRRDGGLGRGRTAGRLPRAGARAAAVRPAGRRGGDGAPR